MFSPSESKGLPQTLQFLDSAYNPSRRQLICWQALSEAITPCFSLSLFGSLAVHLSIALLSGGPMAAFKLPQQAHVKTISVHTFDLNIDTFFHQNIKSLAFVILNAFQESDFPTRMAPSNSIQTVQAGGPGPRPAIVLPFCGQAAVTGQEPALETVFRVFLADFLHRYSI